MRRAVFILPAVLLLTACGDAADPNDADTSADVSGQTDGDGTQDIVAVKSALFTAPFLVIAHRGGRNLRPEHTLEAYNHAASLGPPASPDPVVLELDLRPTSDGAVICMHDADVDRTTDGEGPVHLKTLAELKALDAGYSFKGEGKTFPWRGKGLTVPTLEEVLKAHPNAIYVMEIKRDDPPIIDKVLAALDAHDAIGRTVLSAFNDLDLDEIREKRPDALTGMGIIEMVKFAGLQPDQLDDYVPPALFAQPPKSAMSAEIVAKAHQFGIKVHPWTINKSEDMELMLEYGADGIMTDDPAALIAVRAGQKRPRGTDKLPQPPKLMAHLGVKVGPFQPKESLSGDLVLLKGGPAPIGPFGGPDPDGSGVRPNIALRVKPGTVVRAPVAGEVIQLLEQKSYGDWELHIRPEGWPAGWLVILDHVKDLKVSKGDSVTVDSGVGVATPWSPSWSLVELHLLHEAQSRGAEKAAGTHHCPMDALSQAAGVPVLAAIVALVAERTKPPWRLPAELDGMVVPGCLCHHIVDDEEGSASSGKRLLTCAP